MVSDLITVESRWNLEGLQPFVSYGELEAIKSIPLSYRRTKDKLISHYDKCGLFSVKSAYHVARRWTLPVKFTLSSSNGDPLFESLWDKLWTANVPSKVKMIAWRIPSNIINPMCTFCGVEPESVWHIMIECQFAKGIWRASPLRLQPLVVPEGYLKEWVLTMAKHLKMSDFDCLLMTLWAIWTTRYLKFWGDELNPSPIAVVERAVDWWQDFMGVNAKPVTTSHCSVVPRWSRPPPGRLKVNVDGVWNKEMKIRGVRIVIRDLNRVCVAATSRICEDVFTPIQIDALAARE